MTVKKICCLRISESGVPLCAIIANKCPEIKVTVVQDDPEATFLWNAKQIPKSSDVPGLADLIRKCQNKNLFFTTNKEASIKEGDVIFITSDSVVKEAGEGKGRALDVSMVEEAALSIAEYAESNKIVVENSAVPVKTAECVRRALEANSRPGVKFQVLSNPKFYEEGTPTQFLAVPEWIVIGCEETPEGLAAAKQLSFVYEHWVPREKILVRNNWVTELARVAASAMAAQRLASTSGTAALCEALQADIHKVNDVLERDSRIGDAPLEFRLRLGALSTAASALNYMCEALKLPQAAAYWGHALRLDHFNRDRLENRIMWVLQRTVTDKLVAVLGFASHAGTALTKGSAAVDVCGYLLGEGARVNVYDPKTKEEDVVEALKATGKLNVEEVRKRICVFNDPYRAMWKAHVIVVCAGWPQFVDLDYPRIFAEMEKPAYVFDCETVLKHEDLQAIGFKVYAVGKYILNK